MNEINKILNDESHNDKELVKELSVYVKNNRDKGLPIDGKFIKDIASIVLRNSEIICNGIILTNNKNIDALWDREYKCPIFNLTKHINAINCFKKRKKSKSNCYETIGYYLILRNIIHELTHARQEYILEHKGNQIYSSFYELLDTNYHCYLQHHDETLAERYANLRSSILAYQTLSYIYDPKYIKNLKYDTLNYLLRGYKIDNEGEAELAVKTKTMQTEYVYDDLEIISALDNYNSILEESSVDKIAIDSIENMTLYDRLYLGLPITPLEYVNIYNLYDKLTCEHENIKTLINRLQ